MDPVLVIGGCGGLGSHIVKQLLESGDASDVTVFDIRIDSNRHEGARYVQGTITSEQEVLDVLERVRPRVVMHTASPHLMGLASPEIHKQVNIDGTAHLIKSLQTARCAKALVYTGSSSVIHNSHDNILSANEDWPMFFLPEQKEYYAHTKAVGEKLVRDANGKEGLLTVALRGSTLFGEGDATCTPHMVENAKAGRSKFQIGDGTNLFDFTYIGNIAHAHILAAKILLDETPRPDNMRVDGEAFVITNDEPWPFWDVTRAFASAAGYPIDKKSILVIPPWLYYILAIFVEWGTYIVTLGKKESHITTKMVRYLTMNRTFDISKAKKRLGYRPLVSIQEGIERSVRWYLEHSVESKKK